MKQTIRCPMCKIGFDVELNTEKPIYEKWFGIGFKHCPNCDEPVTIHITVSDKETAVPF